MAHIFHVGFAVLKINGQENSNGFINMVFQKYSKTFGIKENRFDPNNQV